MLGNSVEQKTKDQVMKDIERYIEILLWSKIRKLEDAISILYI